MKVSAKVRYGVKALKYIVENSQEDKLIRIKDISQEESISIRYLEQILFKLKNEGIIEGKRGLSGGYKLIKEPKEITLYQLYRILDEDSKIIDCNVTHESGTECSDENQGVCNCIWGQLDETVKKIFQGITLEDLVKNSKIIE